jgi:hypothetical protein
MDFWRTVLVLVRRWYVALPVFVLSIGLAAMVYASIPTVYVSTSVLVLTTPTTGGSLPVDPNHPNGLTNPLLNFDRGLSTSASILIQALSSPEIAAQLGITEGSPTGFKVFNGSSNPELLTTGPFVFIEGQSSTPEAAQDIVVKVAARARAELANRQKEVEAPESTYITADEIVPRTTPEARKGSKARAAGAAAAVGFIAALSAALGTESFLDNRARNRLRTRARRPGAREPVKV